MGNTASGRGRGSAEGGGVCCYQSGKQHLALLNNYCSTGIELFLQDFNTSSIPSKSPMLGVQIFSLSSRISLLFLGTAFSRKPEQQFSTCKRLRSPLLWQSFGQVCLAIFSGRPVPVFDQSLGKEILPNVQCKPPLAQL